jgi:hypothetical protein
MKIFFNVKNPYYRGLLPEVGDIIRLYNNTYILTSNIEPDIFEMRDMYVGEIKTYSLLRRPFEIIMRNVCKNEICERGLIVKKEIIINDYLQNIKNNEEIKKMYTIPIESSSNYSYCSIM